MGVSRENDERRSFFNKPNQENTFNSDYTLRHIVDYSEIYLSRENPMRENEVS